MFTIGIISIFLVEFIILAQTTFTLWPEIVLYPWLHNNGFLLYKDIINPYFPFLTWFLSWLTKVFGYDTHVFIYFTWGYVFLTQLFFVYVTQKLFKHKEITFISLLVCAILTIIFEGNGLWFDLVVTFPLLLAFYLLIKKKYLLAGIFLGIGLLIKQTVVWTIFGSLLYFVVADAEHSLKRRIQSVIPLLFPITILLTTIGIIFYFQGIFPDFLFWAIKLPFGLMQKTPGFVDLPTKRNILVMLIAFWPSIIFIPKIIKNKILILSLIFFLSTFIFAFPRFGYFHLVAALPFFSLVAGEIFSKRKFIGIVYLFSIGILLIFTVKRTFPFSIRFFDKKTYQVANDIKKETKKEPFFLQNSPQQIYFMNDVLPPKPWAINFPWYLEGTKLQQRIISSVEKNTIKYVVFENYQYGVELFTPGVYKPKIIQNYIDKHFLLKKKIASNMYIYEKNN